MVSQPQRLPGDTLEAFTINSENNITVFGSLSTARKSGSDEVFTDFDSFTRLAAQWPAKRLVEIWNSLSGATPVRKFQSRNIAVTRIYRALETLEPVPAEAQVPCEEEAVAVLGGAARDGSKRARVLELMRQEQGATLEAIMAETGWQKHTVRGFVSGSLVKKGVAVESYKRADGQRAYRVQS